MTDEMTLSQHNEQLILEKHALHRQYQEQQAVLFQVIGALMGRQRTRKLTPAQLKAVDGLMLEVAPDDDGGKIVRLVAPDEGGV